ncbi:hypothetical protein OIU76_012005 [Salix suchowensis]|nr:hypothetical protein OIU76_012005 [Salix suchowensis]
MVLVEISLSLFYLLAQACLRIQLPVLGGSFKKIFCSGSNFGLVYLVSFFAERGLSCRSH